MKIVLASASPRRKELLKILFDRFEVITSDIDEMSTKTVPEEIVKELALKKARAVLPKVSKEDLIISADTLVFLENKQLGKPRSRREAVEMLDKLSSNTHSVYTGFCLAHNGEFLTDFEHTMVTFNDLCATEIEAYVAAGELAKESDYPARYKEKMIKNGWMDSLGKWKTNNGNKPVCMDKAGAYGIQGYASRFIRKIDGCYFNVVGLPISKLYHALKLFCPSSLK